MGASGLRDVIVLLVTFGAIPYIFRQPFIGILMWSWLAYMNPHKLSWGFAKTFPFSKVIALVTLVAVLTNSEISKKIPWYRESKLLLVFTGWMFITTLFAMHPDLAAKQWDKVWKIMLFTFLTMMLIDDRKKVNWLLAIITASIGLYGVKGGIFTLLTGGSYAVYGPTGTFIGGNNEIGLAMIMIVPWMRYFQLVTDKRWVKHLLTLCILTTTIAILGTQSRGALVGLLIMFFFLFMKNLKQIFFVIGAAALLVIAVQFMPDTWHQRMGTIETYEEDKSALGRINAWWMAYNLAVANPVTGGGFDTFTSYAFWLYAPHKNDVHDAHSIWFEILAEHGFVGLGLFLLLGFWALRSSRGVINKTKAVPELRWLFHLGSMMQVSLLGYAAAGTFLGLAYFDMYYALIAIVVIARRLADQGEAKLEDAKKDTAPTGKKGRILPAPG